MNGSTQRLTVAQKVRTARKLIDRMMETQTMAPAGRRFGFDFDDEYVAAKLGFRLRKTMRRMGLKWSEFKAAMNEIVDREARFSGGDTPWSYEQLLFASF